ncbi:MAG: hypothetical protein AB7U85_08075 [Alphaproteobacteria bacterium]
MRKTSVIKKEGPKTNLRQDVDVMNISGQVGIMVESLGAEAIAERIGVSKTTILRWSNASDDYLPNAKQLLDLDLLWNKETGGKPYLIPFLNKKLTVISEPLDKVMEYDLEEETLCCAKLSVDVAMKAYTIQNTQNEERERNIKEAMMSLITLKHKFEAVESKILAHKIHGIELSNKKKICKKKKLHSQDEFIEDYLVHLQNTEKDLYFLIINIYKFLENNVVPTNKKNAVLAADILEDIANKLIDMADDYRYSACNKDRISVVK